MTMVQAGSTATGAREDNVVFVVESSLKGERLVAILAAAIPPHPPVLRINATLVSQHSRQDIVTWATGELRNGRQVSILRASEMA